MGTFTVTIILVVICTLLGAFISGRTRDRCLKNFNGFNATLEKTDGKKVWGVLSVWRTSLEFLYAYPYTDKKTGHIETCYILYKNEFKDIFSVVRRLSDLDEKQLEKRRRILEKTMNPTLFSRLARRARNFFATVRDSLLELVNLFVGRIRTATPLGRMLTSQDKYISQIQSQGASLLTMAFEPILEKYIGKKVVLTMMRGEKKEEYPGILKDYTAEFIEMLDVDYVSADATRGKADLVVPRSIGVIRHAGR